MPEPTGRERMMLLAQPQQSLHVDIKLLLFGCTPFGRERVVRIVWPTTGKITPVIRIAAARHADLIPVIQLGNPAKRQYQSEREFKFSLRAAVCARKARHIVISEKRHKFFGPD